MARNLNKYQYETSPRKLQPDYMPKRTVAPKRVNAKTNSKVKNTNKTKKIAKQKQDERRLVKYLAIGFIVVFAIAYRNSQIDESFAKMQKLKDELSEVQKQNVQLEIAIENSMNLNNVEQQAKELLGMQKLTNKQTVYVNFPKEDYIEVAPEKVIIEEESSIIQKIINWFTNF